MKKVIAWIVLAIIILPLFVCSVAYIFFGFILMPILGIVGKVVIWLDNKELGERTIRLIEILRGGGSS